MTSHSRIPEPAKIPPETDYLNHRELVLYEFFVFCLRISWQWYQIIRRRISNFITHSFDTLNQRLTSKSLEDQTVLKDCATDPLSIYLQIKSLQNRSNAIFVKISTTAHHINAHGIQQESG